MEASIVDQAQKYAELAQMLIKADEEARQDEDAPEFLREALMRLYYAKKLEADMEKCQALLTEETDEETVAAVEESAQAVQQASDAAFDLVESFSANDNEFAEKIDNLKMDTAEDGLDDLLCKLYKCEGIIRLAYRCATRYPTYGITGGILGGEPDTDPVADREDFIAGDMDVDIMALLDARDDLIARIGTMTGDPQ
jgi:hypothetical protein